MREEFEKLKKVAEILLDYRDEVVFDEFENKYTAPCYSTFIPEYIHEINFGWYVFQEQQKKIDSIKEKLTAIYDVCDENTTVAILLDEIQELLK